MSKRGRKTDKEGDPVALTNERLIDLIYQAPISHTGNEAAEFIRRHGGSEEQAQEVREGAQCEHYYQAKWAARRAADEVRQRGGTQAEIGAAWEAAVLEFYPGPYDRRYMP